MPKHVPRGPVAKPEPSLIDCQRCGLTLARWYTNNTCEDCQIRDLLDNLPLDTRKARR